MNKAICLTTDLRFKIRALLLFFIIALILSGLTAFPLEIELRWLTGFCDDGTSLFCTWLRKSYQAVRNTNDAYPFLSYGTDWLAFAHLVIAIVFIGPLMNPVRNIWVIQFGMIACGLVLPLAL